jgi:Icc-related predicted phosphoesterase
VKLLLLSDLHMEFAPFTPDPQAVEEADVVVLAGDIHKGVMGIRWAAETFPSKPVIYVAGNHEFYGGHWDQTLAEMRAEAKALGIHFLENDSVEIDGLRFLGCTLWTDFDYFQYKGRDRRKGAMLAAERGMNDFYLIAAEPLHEGQWGNNGPRLSALHTLCRHQHSLTWLRRELPKGAPARTVVVVHHCPRAESVAPRWVDHSVTPCFASRLPTKVLLGAGLWVHGHTHDSHDYLVGNRTRVVCNPRGYPLPSGADENRAFNLGLLLEVQQQ